MLVLLTSAFFIPGIVCSTLVSRHAQIKLLNIILKNSFLFINRPINIWFLLWIQLPFWYKRSNILRRPVEHKQDWRGHHPEDHWWNSWQSYCVSQWLGCLTTLSFIILLSLHFFHYTSLIILLSLCFSHYTSVIILLSLYSCHYTPFIIHLSLYSFPYTSFLSLYFSHYASFIIHLS